MADPTSIPVILTAILFSLTGCASFASEQPRVTVSAAVVRDLPATHVWLHPGILKDGDLVLPHSKEEYVGIGFYDLAPTERRPDRLKQLRVQGVYYEPWKVGFGQSKWWIWTSDRNWLVLGPDLEKLESKIDGRFTYPVTAPVILGDRAVVYGSGHPEVCRSGTAYFFELDEQGGCVPLLEFNEEETPRNAGMQWLGMAGGLGRAPSGGFAFVDPLRYRVMVFDGKARLERVFQGVNARWHPPNWSSIPIGPGERGTAYWKWAVTQVGPKSPVFLDEDHIAVLVGFGAADGTSQSFELDVYRIDGTPVATGVPVPGISGVGRVHVAQRTQPEAGDSIIVWVEAEFPPPLGDVTKPTQVWAIDVDIWHGEPHDPLPAE